MNNDESYVNPASSLVDHHNSDYTYYLNQMKIKYVPSLNTTIAFNLESLQFISKIPRKILSYK